MDILMNSPFLVLAISFVCLWAAAQLGAALQRRYRTLEPEERDDFGLILGATLTLLGLILGFSFSMAINRYDQRKSYEEEEANAIGTEYVRADLLPGESGAKVRKLLSKYVEQRILFYDTRDERQIPRIDGVTTQLQGELWSAVKAPALERQTPITALAVSGMNDVLNAQGYTQAAWWNRIPTEAWVLMGAIAVCANLLLGFGVRRVRTRGLLLIVLPLVVAVSFCLIADIDSPRGGFVRVLPQNLLSLVHSLHS